MQIFDVDWSKIDAGSTVVGTEVKYQILATWPVDELNTNAVNYNVYDNTDTLLRNLAAGNNNYIKAIDAQKIMTWIAEGRVPTGAFGKANAKHFAVVLEWRKGFLQSIIIAERAIQVNPKLTSAELKSIARAVVNKEAGGMGRAATTVYKKLVSGGKLGVRALGAVAKKVVPGLIFYSFASAAARGYAGEGRQGSSGVLGASLELGREAAFADLVEDIAFPIIQEAADAALDHFVPGGWGPANERTKRKRFGDLLP